MFVMYVSLRGLSYVGCNRYNYLENEPKAAVNTQSGLRETSDLA